MRDLRLTAFVVAAILLTTTSSFAHTNRDKVRDNLRARYKKVIFVEPEIDHATYIELTLALAAGPGGAGAYLEQVAIAAAEDLGKQLAKETILDLLRGKKDHTMFGGEPVYAGIATYNHWTIEGTESLTPLVKIARPNTHQLYVAFGRRGHANQLDVPNIISNGFSSDDRLFAVDGNRVYWQCGRQLRRARVQGAKIDIDLRFDGFHPTADRLFAAQGNTVWWQDQNGVRRAQVTDNGLIFTLRWNGFDPKVDRLFHAYDNDVYWQAEHQFRHGRIEGGDLKILCRWNGFDGRVDRLFGAYGNVVLWQAGHQLRRGRIAGNNIHIDYRNDMFDGRVDRLFTLQNGHTVYWQAGRQLRQFSFFE